MKLLHGTSTLHLESILATGLRLPWVTRSRELAQYFAEVEAEEKGGEPVILQVECDPGSLRHDEAQMDEPVGFEGRTSKQVAARVQREWNRLARLHPAWVSDDMISVPETEFEISLKMVGTAYSIADIAPQQIEVLP